MFEAFLFDSIPRTLRASNRPPRNSHLTGPAKCLYSATTELEQSVSAICPSRDNHHLTKPHISNGTLSSVPRASAKAKGCPTNPEYISDIGVRAMQGKIDLVTSEGIVEGWCWNETAPAEKLTVSIKIDGSEVGRVFAGHYRADLLQAGIGDGFHFFRFVIPRHLMTLGKTHVLTVNDCVTGHVFGDAYSMEVESDPHLDERLTQLEARNRLLESRITELANSKGSNREQAELFAIVGTFFERLSRDLARGGNIISTQTLSDAMRVALQAYPTITFTATAPSDVSILVNATCALGDLYQCLHSLIPSSRSTPLRLTVMDTGRSDDVVLISSIARNVRYIRTMDYLVTEWAEAALNESSRILVLLSGTVTVCASFIKQLCGSLENDSEVAAVGGYVAGSDGSLQRGGFDLIGGKLAVSEELDASDSLTELRSVHALSDCAAAFRVSAIREVGGLDPLFGDNIEAAVIDLCFRLRRAGWSVICDPRATFSPQTADGSGRAKALGPMHTREMDLLEQRWLNSSTPASSSKV